ncbi:hypothetical protein [uncultured Cyclobacterium sp.]|uniref:hypothetical protein n=1 Tax=uncultured Cyclobacterium sp. TaxID=453820 RepID=UPI0030EF35F4|tara:strand:- start:2012 stop:2779 length:768 start_codon:yes stop_codon:yes gene_type:complete
MSEFNLNTSELYDILVKKGITNLFHANTVSTSITFLNNKSLLSRKFVTDNNLFQTDQYSDEKDKKFDIYDDIFLDFVDIHEEWKKYNFYGPFLFVFSIELLKSNEIKTLRITKKNPVHWRETETESDWYYSNLKDFDKNYKKGNKLKDVGSMIILKDIDGKLPLRPNIKKFLFDNPNLFVNYKDEKNYLANLIGVELKKIVKKNGFEDIKRDLRHKSGIARCACWFQYNVMLLRDIKKLKKLFHQKPIEKEKKDI